jgi:hypothetical protein
MEYTIMQAIKIQGVMFLVLVEETQILFGKFTQQLPLIMEIIVIN